MSIPPLISSIGKVDFQNVGVKPYFGEGEREWGRDVNNGKRLVTLITTYNNFFSDKTDNTMSNIQKVQLPPQQPDRCIDCPLLGLVPKYVARPKNSKETHVCIGTREALTQRSTKISASGKDKNHPLRRPCDGVWETWMTLPRRILLVNRETYRECRIPYESTLQMQIKFHKG